MNTIIKKAFTNALLTTLYVVLIATFMSNTSTLFGSDEPKTVFVPIMMLLILIFSAALTGSLVFGRPILWYLDGKKKEAFSLLAYTLGFILMFIILAIALLFVYLPR